uniref:NADH-ubiquinone oxidoreductase chain 6 n=2 Tax=Coptotermes TaxID=36986 RepID=F7J2G7_COPFO|nr:NADH dehydrogenase subunit 6 [Coptotermes formosanus]YP_009463883.1 NADH dehydrogenase subunit 6 [Coptotermes suzhouensis]AMX22637.1 NADH dehydrogenase subunit 6 [Coptotermes formosanus]AUW55173.1 NADH dehydrogenase subunit 6 [Coptotermes suzhouensis]BAK40287.1 NADH dehydrogenase subunit 6 [Coptotermes formosanus]BAK40300.1 NADH dehydrogenase subunit 6 [Coptotermes formosanus]BAK40313.1 NADH dehydrogenase subunit 6 [Coptotermes formosanus]
MTKLIMSMSMMTSMMFTQMKHPLAMGMMLLMQTMMTCLISGTMYKSFWFSYILFMIMIGGMLVLFMYMTSLASNEMFSPSNKMILIALMTSPTLTYIMPDQMNNKEMNMHNTTMENEITLTTTMMYNQNTGAMTILLVMYMLLTLIVVVNIINISSGPLRHMN